LRQHRQNPGSGPTGYVALGGDRFDQACVIILDVSDPRARRPAGHSFRGKRRQQRLQLGCIRKLLSEPDRLTFGFEDHRHAVVKRRAQFVRFEDARAVISVALQHGIQRFERRADNPGRAAPSALPERGPCCWREPPTGSIRRYPGECGLTVDETIMAPLTILRFSGSIIVTGSRSAYQSFFPV
jgi:hypothetical protein